MNCGRPACSNAGIWKLHATEFNGDRWRCEDHLRGALIDRYSIVNRIEYVGIEVAITNAYVDEMQTIKKRAMVVGLRRGRKQ